MEHWAPHTRAIYAATCLEREVAEVRTGSSPLNFFQEVFTCGWKFTGTVCWEHVSSVAKGSYHLQLVRSIFDFPLWSAVQGACSFLAPCTTVIRVLCQVLEPIAFLVHPVLQPLQDAVAAHSSATDGAWKLTWTLQEVQACTTDHDLHLSCIYSSPFSFIAFFKVKSLLTYSSSNSAMITRSLAKRSSQGTPEQSSLDKASSTMMKSSGLSTKPWWTPTFSSLSSLYPSPTQTQLHTLEYIPCTSRTIHSSTPSFLSAHQMIFRGTWSNAFYRSTKAM